MTGWIDLFRSLGGSLAEVLKAELAALQEELGRSGRHLGVALGLLGGAAVLLFWTLGLLLFTLIVVLDVWLPLWAAALIVFALFALVAGILAQLGVRRLRRVENPVESVKRRVEDHIDWWQSRLLAETKPVGSAKTPAAALEEEDLP